MAARLLYFCVYIGIIVCVCVCAAVQNIKCNLLGRWGSPVCGTLTWGGAGSSRVWEPLLQPTINLVKDWFHLNFYSGTVLPYIFFFTVQIILLIICNYSILMQW